MIAKKTLESVVNHSVNSPGASAADFYVTIKGDLSPII